jgi:hypothetical protein
MGELEQQGRKTEAEIKAENDKAKADEKAGIKRQKKKMSMEERRVI